MGITRRRLLKACQDILCWVRWVLSEAFDVAFIIWTSAIVPTSLDLHGGTHSGTQRCYSEHHYETWKLSDYFSSKSSPVSSFGSCEGVGPLVAAPQHSRAFSWGDTEEPYRGVMGQRSYSETTGRCFSSWNVRVEECFCVWWESFYFKDTSGHRFTALCLHHDVHGFITNIQCHVQACETGCCGLF